MGGEKSLGPCRLDVIAVFHIAYFVGRDEELAERGEAGHDDGCEKVGCFVN